MTNVPADFSSSLTVPAAFHAFAARVAARPFVAPRLLRNAHAMTILGAKRPRRFALSLQIAERREFRTEPQTTVVAYCHWQPQRQTRPTVFIIHGLEGSADAAYVWGTADKAWAAGFNVIRYNVRSCGDSVQLAPTLYHSGLTADLHHVTQALLAEEQLPELFVIGFSMGGNQALKWAGELGAQALPQVRGVVAISPPIDLAQCSRAIRQPENFIYEARFLLSLQRHLRRKNQFFPGQYDLTRLRGVRHLWDWDEAFQPYNGFAGALDYYQRASSLPYLPAIQVPTLILAAQDDPFIPFTPFADERLRANRRILLVGPAHGGHVAFCGSAQPDEDRAWAENRAVEFCRLLQAAV